MSKIIRSNDELNALANGKELVVNGTDLETTRGWDVIGTPTIVDGGILLNNDTDRVSTQLHTAIGSTYEVSISAVYNAAPLAVTIGTTSFGYDTLANTYTSSGVKSFQFTATTSLLYLSLDMYGASSAYYSNISVKEIPQVQGENLPDYVATRSNYGFKNYIINGSFDVWQRGTSFTGVSNGVYTADRWLSNISGNWNVSKDNGYKIVAGATPTFIYLNTRLEEPNKLSLKTVTLSFTIDSSINTTILVRDRINGSGSVVRDTVSISIGKNTYTTSYQIADYSSYTSVSDFYQLELLFGNAYTVPTGAIFIVSNVQLEEGSVATPFEQRPYGLELSLCQRYYQMTSPVLAVKAGDLDYRSWLFPVELRVLPTFIATIQSGSGATFAANSSGFRLLTSNNATAVFSYTADAEL